MPEGEKTISEFIDALVTDPALEESFNQHARQTMKDFGLGNEQIRTVLDKRLSELKHAIESEVPGAKLYAFRVKMH